MSDARQPAEQAGSSGGEDLLAVGQTISHYKILRKLGEGGMGQVYLADDLELHRKVAIKTLTADVTRDHIRLQRFKNEAQSVAKLNHPNIVTIYSHEISGSCYFLTMEFVAGPTLSELIRPGGMRLERLFEIAVPLADAIAAAHEKGITHRDIKPGNVMIGEDGRVKVLDFGLAKLRESRRETKRDPESGDDPDTETTGQPTELLTREGARAGTFPYMSPEQFRAQRVDQRTDIYSLGVVLYQMATGRRPFEGKSQVDLISSVMRDAPPPLSGFRPDLPHHLERIVRRCLEKDPERRYQSAKDLRNDLDDFRRELDEDTRTGTLRIRRPRPLVAKALWLCTGVAAVALAWGITAFLQRDSSPLSPAGRPRQVTATPGWEAEAVLSPDGALLAYESEESGSADIWLIDVHGGNRIRLTDHPGHERDPSWYPDGSAVAFESVYGERSSIWKVPRLGGSATILVANAADPAVSPDGSLIAFSQLLPDGEERIGVASLHSTEPPRTLTGPADGLWTQEQPAWSPDGKTLCYADASDLWLVPVAGGPARRLTDYTGGDHEPVWSTDGRFIYFSSYREGTLALWRVAVAGGEPQRLTMGTGPERHASISRDGSRFAYTTFDDSFSVLLIDLATGERHELLGGRSDWSGTFAPDLEAVVFASDRRGRYSLWRQPVAGITPVGEAIRLNDEPADSGNPTFSPDGSWIAYQRRAGAERNIWVLPATGGLPAPLTDGPVVRAQPDWSPDGSRIAFLAYPEGTSQLWLLPVADGRPAGDPEQIVLPATDLVQPDWSPDGRQIAVTGTAEGKAEVWLVSVDGGALPRQLTQGAGAVYARWHPSGRTLMVSGSWGEDELSLREVDLDTGRAAPLHPPVILGPRGGFGQFDLSADGRFVALTDEQAHGDLWILEAEPGTF